MSRGRPRFHRSTYAKAELSHTTRMIQAEAKVDKLMKFLETIKNKNKLTPHDCNAMAVAMGET